MAERLSATLFALQSSPLRSSSAVSDSVQGHKRIAHRRFCSSYRHKLRRGLRVLLLEPLLVLDSRLVLSCSGFSTRDWVHAADRPSRDNRNAAVAGDQVFELTVRLVRSAPYMGYEISNFNVRCPETTTNHLHSADTYLCDKCSGMRLST